MEAQGLEHGIADRSLVEHHCARDEQAGDGCNCPAKGAYIIVSDTRVPAIDETPKLDPDLTDLIGIRIRGTRIVTGKAKPKHDLLWYIDQLPSNGALSLRYSLPYRTVFKAETNSQDLKIISEDIHKGQGRFRYTFVIKNKGQSDQKNVTLTVQDSRIVLSDTTVGRLTKHDNTVVKKSPGIRHEPGAYEWTIDELPKGTQATLSFWVNKKAGG